MLVTRDRFAQGKTQRVRLLMDQKIEGVSCKSGDVCDLPYVSASYLKDIGRVEYATVDVTAAADEKAIRATRGGTINAGI